MKTEHDKTETGNTRQAVKADTSPGVAAGRNLFFWVMLLCGMIVISFITLPLFQMMLKPSSKMMMKAIGDPDVRHAIGLSLITSIAASMIAFLFGTPLAYLLARVDFPGKHIVEGIVDIPVAIPHPVIGIAILTIAGQGHWFGNMLSHLGIQLMGTPTGIITVLTFVGLPFYVNAVKTGFESVPRRLENVSRSLGASMWHTFMLITLPLCRRSILVGLIMCCARAISEFGAVIIVAYHPMTAPVLIYERFEAYGLKYSQPVAVWLVLVSLVLFIALRIAHPGRKACRA